MKYLLDTHAVLRARFDLIASELPRSVWTDGVSEHFGAIKAALERKGQRIEDFDAAIAAHALAEKGGVGDSQYRPHGEGA